MKSLQGIIGAGFLFLGSVILLCFGMAVGSTPLLLIGGFLALISGILLIIPILREIYSTEDEEKMEGDDHNNV